MVKIFYENKVYKSSYNLELSSLMGVISSWDNIQFALNAVRDDSLWLKY